MSVGWKTEQPLNEVGKREKSFNKESSGSEAQILDQFLLKENQEFL